MRRDLLSTNRRRTLRVKTTPPPPRPRARAGIRTASPGFLLALAVLGVDLTKVTILPGAFGVGIGFGLQNVVNNFVSGLLVLLPLF